MSNTKNKPPAFQFYASDFLTDYKVVVMSMEARGVYITLLAHAWLEKGLPDSEAQLARLCAQPENWSEIWGEVRPCFEEKDGRLYNKRMEREREQLKSYIESRKVAGLKGAQARWGSEDKDSKRIAKPKQKDSSSTSTSSSTSKKNKSLGELFESEFEELWKIIPNKKDKKRAFKAFAKARNSVSFSTIKEAYVKQLKAYEVDWKKDGWQYCPHPTTWLNGERWNDEIIIVNKDSKNGDAPSIPKELYVCPRCGNSKEHNRDTWVHCQNKHVRERMLPESVLTLEHIQEYVTAIKEEG